MRPSWIVLNRSPKTIAAGELAIRALGLMEEWKITALVVLNQEQTVLGVVHLHDVLRALEIEATPPPQPKARS